MTYVKFDDGDGDKILRAKPEAGDAMTGDNRGDRKMRNGLAAAAIGAVLVFMSSIAAAWPVLSLIPSPSKVHPPENVRVDLVVSGLRSEGISLGSFDVTIEYDPTALVLLPSGFQWGNRLGDPTDSYRFGDPSVPGVLRFLEVSLLSEGELDALQTDDSFELASILFYVPPLSDSSIDATIVSIVAVPATVLSDATGRELLFDTQNATILITEPGIAGLLGAAFVTVAAVRRRAPSGKP